MIALHCYHETPTAKIYTLSLHDALPIFESFSGAEEVESFDVARVLLQPRFGQRLRLANPFAKLRSLRRVSFANGFARRRRSEEHTSELQSRLHLVCRLLLEKKNYWIV